MNRILILFNILISFSAINFIRGQNQEIALLFHTKTNTIANRINPKETDICEKCATACPLRRSSVFTTEENRFKNQHSISKKIFFIEKIYPNDVPMGNINLNICETPFELTLVYNKLTNGIEFGYELYYDESLPNSELLIEGVYGKYGELSMLPTSTEPAVNRILFRTVSFGKSFSFPRDNPKLPLGDKKMKFLWIPVFNLSYNEMIKSPNRVSYETSVNVTDSSNECQNYKLGGEIYGGIKMNRLYRQEYLDEVFKNTVIPKRSPKGPSYDLAPEMEVIPGHVCITRWNLVPEKYFHYYSPKSLSCSYLTTVPAWCYLADGLLKRLDEYLEVMTRIMPEKKLHITSGTSGTLQMNLKHDVTPKGNILQGSKTFVGMYLLHQKTPKRIPIPAIIYKLIEFKSSTCPENQTTCWYSIFIEIHNSPYFKTEDKICKEAIKRCEEWGWTSFYQNDTVQSRFVYCCKTTKYIEKKLKLRQEERQSEYYIFNLNEYKINYTEEFEVISKSLKQMADEEIKRLEKAKSGNTRNEEEPEAREDGPSGSYQPNPGEAMISLI